MKRPPPMETVDQVTRAHRAETQARKWAGKLQPTDPKAEAVSDQHGEHRQTDGVALAVSRESRPDRRWRVDKIRA